MNWGAIFIVLIVITILLAIPTIGATQLKKDFDFFESLKTLLPLDGWVVQDLNLTNVLSCDEALETDAYGRIICGSDQIGGGGGGDSVWVDAGTWLEPNDTYADNVKVYGYIHAHDWSNVTITEEQITDLDHYDSSDFASDFSEMTTDNLAEGSSNLYDNQSWNETLADSKYLQSYTETDPQFTSHYTDIIFDNETTSWDKDSSDDYVDWDLYVNSILEKSVTNDANVNFFEIYPINLSWEPIADDTMFIDLYHCADNEILKMNSTGWNCEEDVSGEGGGGEDTGNVTQVNLTSSTHDGSIINGTSVGYRAAHEICALEFPGSHMCNQNEVSMWLRHNNFGHLTVTDYGWVIAGGPKYAPAPIPVNDCDGWRDETKGSNLGNYWEFNSTTGGVGKVANCDETLSLLCCS